MRIAATLDQMRFPPQPSTPQLEYRSQEWINGGALPCRLERFHASFTFRKSFFDAASFEFYSMALENLMVAVHGRAYGA